MELQSANLIEHIRLAAKEATPSQNKKSHFSYLLEIGDLEKKRKIWYKIIPEILHRNENLRQLVVQTNEINKGSNQSRLKYF